MFFWNQSHGNIIRCSECKNNLWKKNSTSRDKKLRFCFFFFFCSWPADWAFAHSRITFYIFPQMLLEQNSSTCLSRASFNAVQAHFTTFSNTYIQCCGNDTYMLWVWVQYSTRVSVPIPDTCTSFRWNIIAKQASRSENCFLEWTSGRSDTVCTPNSAPGTWFSTQINTVTWLSKEKNPDGSSSQNTAWIDQDQDQDQNQDLDNLGPVS